MSETSLRSLAAFGSGLLFSVGLGVAGMTRPSKVIGFLDLFGRWDASLALVMGSAVVVGLVSFPLVLRRASPLLAPRYLLPAARGIDARLLAGAALFGAGWGLAGVCPGPALAALATGAPAFLVFGLGMAGGTVAANRLAHRPRSAPNPRSEETAETAETAATPFEAPRAETTCG